MVEILRNHDNKIQCVMFDLDGTITDSGKIILESVRHALLVLDYPIPDETQLRKFVGPSLMDSFMNICGMDVDTAQKATDAYRRYYETDRLFDVVLYDGIEDTLSELNKRKIENILVTSKPYEFAVRILKKFDLYKFFSYVSAPGFDDPSSDKSRLIDKALKHSNMEENKSIMVGDTHFDIDGAVSCGVSSAGVLYGYGSRSELASAGADYLISEPEDLLQIVFGGQILI
jgi:phosphoglycolate phosphatase